MSSGLFKDRYDDSEIEYEEQITAGVRFSYSQILVHRKIIASMLLFCLNVCVSSTTNKSLSGGQGRPHHTATLPGPSRAMLQTRLLGGGPLGECLWLNTSGALKTCHCSCYLRLTYSQFSVNDSA